MKHQCKDALDWFGVKHAEFQTSWYLDIRSSASAIVSSESSLGSPDKSSWLKIKFKSSYDHSSYDSLFFNHGREGIEEGEFHDDAK